MRIPRLARRLRAHHADAAPDGGFTMIEAIVAFTIFVVITVAATNAIVSGNKASTNSRNRVNATNIVQSDLEQARAQTTPSAATYSSAPAGGSITYSVSRTVTMPNASGTTTCPAGSLIKVSTVASWGGPAAGSVRAATVIAC